jgi:hypothetical protein
MKICGLCGHPIKVGESYCEQHKKYFKLKEYEKYEMSDMW